VISQEVALTKAILPAKLLLHNVYHNIAQRANWNSFVSLSTAKILDLEDWRHGLSTWNGRLANLQLCDVLGNTNASLTGWGASLGAMMSSPTHTSAGWLPPSEQCHINVLKITTVHNALKSFLPLLTQGSVGALQQHCNCGSPQPHGREEPTDERCYAHNSPVVQILPYPAHSNLLTGSRQHGGRLPEPPVAQIA